MRESLVGWTHEAVGDDRALRLIGAPSLHVTLVFLGYQYERDVEQIAGLCFDDRPGAFELRATAVGGIPPRRPRLYALGLEEFGLTWADERTTPVK